MSLGGDLSLLNKKFKVIAKRRVGFTLVELLVTISIISLLTIIMIPALRSFDRRNRVESAAEQMKAALMEVRNYSMSPRSGDSNLDRYVLKFINTSDRVTYELGFCSKTGATSAEACKSENFTLILEKKLPKGVSVEDIKVGGVDSTVTEIGFKVPNSEVVFDNQTKTGLDINLKSVNNDEETIVNVNGATGMITFKEVADES